MKPERKHLQLNMRIDPKTKTLLDSAAFALHQSKSGVLREAIEFLVESKRKDNLVLDAIMKAADEESIP